MERYNNGIIQWGQTCRTILVAMNSKITDRLSLKTDNYQLCINLPTILKKLGGCYTPHTPPLGTPLGIPLHSWEMGLSIQYHVTIINQLNDLNLMGYYIISIPACKSEKLLRVYIGLTAASTRYKIRSNFVLFLEIFSLF